MKGLTKSYFSFQYFKKDFNYKDFSAVIPSKGKPQTKTCKKSNPLYKSHIFFLYDGSPGSFNFRIHGISSVFGFFPLMVRESLVPHICIKSTYLSNRDFHRFRLAQEKG